MIYGKIYLDEDENGAALLVFEAAKREDRNEIYLSHAKNVYDKSGRLRFSSPLTCIYGAPLVAIGHRAKAVLAARLADASSYDLSREGGDLEFRGRHDDDSGFKYGMFAFRPDECGDGRTKRVLGAEEHFTVLNNVEFSPEIIEDMIPFADAYLKQLVLDAPVHKASLFQNKTSKE